MEVVVIFMILLATPVTVVFGQGKFDLIISFFFLLFVEWQYILWESIPLHGRLKWNFMVKVDTLNSLSISTYI